MYKKISIRNNRESRINNEEKQLLHVEKIPSSKIKSHSSEFKIEFNKGLSSDGKIS